MVCLFAATEPPSLLQSLSNTQRFKYFAEIFHTILQDMFRPKALVRVSHFLRHKGINRTGLPDDDVSWIDNTLSSQEARYVSHIVLFGAAA